MNCMFRFTRVSHGVQKENAEHTQTDRKHLRLSCYTDSEHNGLHYILDVIDEHHQFFFSSLSKFCPYSVNIILLSQEILLI